MPDETQDYKDRPEAVAAEHTKRAVQPRVAYVDAFRVFGLRRKTVRDDGVGVPLIQANLYCNCIGLDLENTLAYQATVHMPPETAMSLAGQLMAHGNDAACGIMVDGLAAREMQDPELTAEVQSLVNRRMCQLQAEIDQLLCEHLQRIEGDDVPEPEEDE